MSTPVAERESFPVTHFPDEMKNAPARLRIAVIADNVNAAYYTIELKWEWENYVYSEAGRDAFDARLLDGHAAPTGNPHLLAGGPWGEAAARAASGSNDLPDRKD